MGKKHNNLPKPGHFKSICITDRWVLLFALLRSHLTFSRRWWQIRENLSQLGLPRALEFARLHLNVIQLLLLLLLSF